MAAIKKVVFDETNFEQIIVDNPIEGENRPLRQSSLGSEV